MSLRDTSTPQRPAVVFGLSACAVVLIASAWHLSALRLYMVSAGDGSLDTRLAAAQTASRLEPWNARFEWRELTLRAERLLEDGRIDAAFWLLQPYSQTVRGDDVYREVYQRAVSQKAPLDARKAHVQHGKEKEGGVLAPEDVQR